MSNISVLSKSDAIIGRLVGKYSKSVIGLPLRLLMILLMSFITTPSYPTTTTEIYIDKTINIEDVDVINFKNDFNLIESLDLYQHKIELNNGTYLNFIINTSDKNCYIKNCLITFVYKNKFNIKKINLYAKNRVRIWVDYNLKENSKQFGVFEFDTSTEKEPKYIYIHLVDDNLIFKGHEK